MLITDTIVTEGLRSVFSLHPIKKLGAVNWRKIRKKHSHTLFGVRALFYDILPVQRLMAGSLMCEPPALSREMSHQTDISWVGHTPLLACATVISPKQALSYLTGCLPSANGDSDFTYTSPSIHLNRDEKWENLTTLYIASFNGINDDSECNFRARHRYY